MKEVDGTDTVKITDFGLAESSDKRTVFFTVGGSLQYMASARYRKCINVFSLGMLCGHLIKVSLGQDLEVLACTSRKAVLNIDCYNCLYFTFSRYSVCYISKCVIL